ncbi:MAG: Gfo/Idh/MocA family oxidoreductase, partial [bacterium]|nr:Gfo/Idh/MocA family oxidoreductase [bacterium]
MNNLEKNPATSNQYDRRDFLKGLAALPVFGVFIASYLAKRSHDRSRKNTIFADLDINLEELENSEKATSSIPGESIRLGIIGVGSRGEDILASLGFSEHNDKNGDDSYADLNIMLAGACDVYDTAAEKGIALSQFNQFSTQRNSTGRAKRFRHYQEMLESKDIDAVIIATPDHWHQQMVIDAARSGKHIYCEKCLTRTIEEADQVRKAIKASNVVFQYGHQNRQQNAYHVARKIIEKNILGKITLIKTHTNRNTPEGAWLRHLNRNIDPNAVDWQQWLGNTPQQPFSPSRYFGWQKFFEYSGGLPAHMFSHEYDAINQIFNLGIPKSVLASGGIYYWKDDRNTPDVFQAIFEYPDRELLLTYDATLASSSTGEYQTGAKTKEIYGSDAWMKLSMDINVMADRHSRRFKQKIDDGMIQPSLPFLSYRPGLKPGSLDVVTSASERYYASQGLVYTYQGG